MCVQVHVGEQKGSRCSCSTTHSHIVAHFYSHTSWRYWSRRSCYCYLRPHVEAGDLQQLTRRQCSLWGMSSSGAVVLHYLRMSSRYSIIHAVPHQLDASTSVVSLPAGSARRYLEVLVGGLHPDSDRLMQGQAGPPHRLVTIAAHGPPSISPISRLESRRIIG